MELNVIERLVLLNILPREGSFLTLKLVRKIREDLSFDELENKVFKFVQDGEVVRWDESVVQTKDIEIGEKMTDLIVDVLKELDKKKGLKEEHLTLYEKFIDA